MPSRTRWHYTTNASSIFFHIDYHSNTWVHDVVSNNILYIIPWALVLHAFPTKTNPAFVCAESKKRVINKYAFRKLVRQIADNLDLHEFKFEPACLAAMQDATEGFMGVLFERANTHMQGQRMSNCPALLSMRWRCSQRPASSIQTGPQDSEQ